jgi:Fe-S-cluster containining protein
MEETQTERTHCIRCGTCCRSGSPTLHAEDAEKVLNGVVNPANLYTIRRGEVVRDNIKGGLAVLSEERIKVRERERPPYPSACGLYDYADKACEIYENRPAQCAALECWDTSTFMRLYGQPRLERRDIIRDEKVFALIEEHEQRCAYVEIERVIKKIGAEGKKAISHLIDIIQYDHRVRHIAVHEFGQSAQGMDLLFGRGLIHTLVMFGLKAETRQDGSLLLKRVH